jgi:hypothetical protein
MCSTEPDLRTVGCQQHPLSSKVPTIHMLQFRIQPNIAALGGGLFRS